MSSLMSVVRGSTLGLAAGMLLLFVVELAYDSQARAVVDTNVYAGPGVSPANCENWRDDTNWWPEAGHQFNWYWSGQPWWWNEPAAHYCWHNDEAGSSNWRAGDYAGGLDQPLSYITTVYASNATPTQYFTWSTAGCGGINVQMWNIYGAFAGNMHYWHVWIWGGVAQTSWVNHWYVPGQSVHYREIGGLRAAGADGCYSTGIHVHHAVFESTKAVPYRLGNMNVHPFYFK
jgi:hypothetical protein